jgi:MFS transporter, SP family, solute carrier family 2 (myo-inositol transporter), member 13
MTASGSQPAGAEDSRKAGERAGASGKGRIYALYLLCIAGLGGLLYGADIGIIAAALLYVSRTISLTLQQTSVIVAAVLGGSMVSSLAAGVLGDWMGRRKMMIVSGLMFVASIVIIVFSHGFTELFAGRLLQGMSGGVIAVVVPLYLAECLSASHRGRGTAIFQFMLTFGIVVAAVIGWFYTRQAETAIAMARGNPVLIGAAQNHAWRSMFLCVIYPGLLFFAGSFALDETPRWLLRKGRQAEAWKALRRSLSEPEAALAQREMEEQAAAVVSGARAQETDSLLQRRYVVPFLLACVILACTQATGINSILSFLVLILRQAGMSTRHATQGDVAVKLINCIMTLVAVWLVDRKGRRFLLRVGTGGILFALLATGLLFFHIESRRADIRNTVQSFVEGNHVTLPMSELASGGGANRAAALTVVYSYGDGTRVATTLSDNSDPVLRIEPEANAPHARLTILRAWYGAIPTEGTGWLAAACLAVFIMSFAVGPGVVVWLTLSELMPTRIRSSGMGIALLLNQGISTLIAAVFLPVAGMHGYFAMFLFWAGCTVVYFVTATFFLPETKGRTLEEIERFFEGNNAALPGS